MRLDVTSCLACPRGLHGPGHTWAWLLWAHQLKWKKSRPSCRHSDLRLSSNAPPVRSCGNNSSGSI